MEKTEIITFRITEKKKAEILIRCLDLNKNISDYIRYLIDKDIEESKK